MVKDLYWLRLREGSTDTAINAGKVAHWKPHEAIGYWGVATPCQVALIMQVSDAGPGDRTQDLTARYSELSETLTS